MATRTYLLSLVILVSSAHYDTGCSDCNKTQSLVLNFHQPDAYVAMKLDHRSKLLYQLEFELLTQKINSQLLSLRSAIRSHDSISRIDLNVKSGSLYVHIESESGIWQSHSDLTIRQGEWCSVKLSFTPACLEVIIDGENERLFSGSPVVPMLGKYFVVNFANDSQFIGKYAPKSYSGCLRRVILNNQPLLRNQILASRDLEYDCTCESDILNETTNNNCPKRSNHDDELISDENLSYKRDDALSTAEKDYSTITVEEGGTVNLKVDDFGLLSLGQFTDDETSDLKDIFFNVVEKPQNGHLVMDGSGWSLDNFTMQDVLKGKISYKHDGSETIDDVIEIELLRQNHVLRDAPYNSRKFLATHRRPYNLAVKVTPKNDRPRLELPRGTIFRIAGRSKIRMSYDHISVFDSDDLPLDVRVFINYPVDFSQNCAQFETAVDYFDTGTPKKPLSGFSAEDLKNGQIFLKHYGDISKCDLELIAEDSAGAQSPIVKIFVESYSVNFKLLKNTGLRSFPFGHVIIRKENLSFATESWNKEAQLYYVIVKNPNAAVLEVKSRNQWKNASIFTQNDIDQNMVRFTVIKKSAAVESDSFQFCVNTEPRPQSEIHDFHVQFIKPEFQLHTSLFLLNNTVNRTISRHHLFAWVPNVEPLHASDVIYKIYKSPSYGFLYRVMDSNTGRTRKLGANSNFTQSDLDMDLIFYKLRKFHQTVISDEFTFRLCIHSYESDMYKFFVTSLPHVDDDTKLADQILKVREGGSASIANGTFHLGAVHNEMLTFLVIKPPENGQLFKIQPQSPKVVLGLGQSFNLIDVQSHFIFYKHDDSETANDSVKFIVQSQSEKVRETFELKIDIQLENDNLPVQGLSTIGKVFQIVKNGQRTVTNRFLKYNDLDVDFDDQFLTYEFDLRVADVEFYHISNMRTKIYNFTQRNIDDQVIIYKHAGYANYYRLLYTVTDGKHKVHGQLAVNASDPFVRLVVPKDFSISTNGTFQINEQNLTVDTNQDLRNEEILLKLKKQTKHVKLVKDQLFVTEFTFAQLLGDHLAVTLVNNLDLETPKFNKFAFYENLHIVVSAGHLTADSKIKVHVIAEENREDNFSIVKAGKNLTVENGGYSILSAENFEIIDSTDRIPADQIKFIVVGPPIYGNLLTFDTNAMSGYLDRSDYSLQVFTLSDVNRGSLRYLHDPRKSFTTAQFPQRDHLILQLMISDEKRGKFTLPIIIISRKLSLDVKNLTAVRGHRTCLTGDTLWIKENLNEIQEELNPDMLNFRIDQKPSYGRIELMDDGQVDNFTMRHVLDRRICYRNFDVGDSIQRDLFKISAHYSVDKENRTSDQLAIHVNIVKDNIKAPELVRNEHLHVTNGRFAQITPDNLNSTDTDTADHQLYYIVMDAKNGQLRMTDDDDGHFLEKSVHNFTQADINANRVVFNYDGEQQHGGFSFILFDGKHRSGVYWFTIKLPEVGHILQTNARLVIAPKATMILKQKHLLAQSSLANSSRLLYLVMESPKYGSLLVNGDLAKTFTQWDIDGGHVTYRQYKPVHSWITRDGFSFRLTIKGLGQDLIVDNTIHKFRILITYAAYEGEVLSRIVPTSTLRLVSGQKIPLNLGHVNISGLMESVKSPLIVSIARIPQYGKLELNGQEVADSSSNDSTAQEISLNPKILFTGNLTYEYLHTTYANDTNSTDMETLQDFMILEIYPEIDSGRHRKLTRLKIPLLIEIAPFWKNKVQLKRAPKWINVQKFGAYLITNEDLLVDCLSAKPTDIVYRLTRSPTNGRIIIRRREEDLFQKRISDPFFTQNDIDEGLVWFRHDGSAHESDFITFQVSNFAEENPGTITHTIKVLVEPSPLKLVNFSNILAYFQGKSEVIFRKVHLAAEVAGRDGLPSKVTYVVIAAPENGTLINLETRKSINRFTQMDVDQSRIAYVPWNLASYKDEIGFAIQYKTLQMEKIMLLRTKPALVQCREVIIGPNLLLTFGLTMLRLLDEKHESLSPNFLVVAKPAHGRLIVGSQVYAPNDIINFTYSDLKNGRLTYRCNYREVRNVLYDFFRYEFQMEGVQPAQSRFAISIHPDVSTVKIVPAEAGFSDFDTNNNDRSSKQSSTVRISSLHPNITHDHSVIILIAVPTLLVGLMIIVIRRVRIGNKRQRRFKREKEELQRKLMNAAMTREVPIMMSNKRSHSDLMSFGSTTGTTKVGSPSVSTDRRTVNERTASIKSASQYMSSPLHNTMLRSSPIAQHNSRSIQTVDQRPPMLTDYMTLQAPTDTSTSRLITFDPTTSANSLKCAVTAIGGGGASTAVTTAVSDVLRKQSGQGALKSASTCSSSSSSDEARYGAYQRTVSDTDQQGGGGFRQLRKPPRSPVKQMKLKENQYWV